MSENKATAEEKGTDVQRGGGGGCGALRYRLCVEGSALNPGLRALGENTALRVLTRHANTGGRTPARE